MLPNLITRYRQLTQAMPLVGSRSIRLGNLADGATAAELRFQSRGAALFERELKKLYTRPLSRLGSLVRMNEADMRRTILNMYDDPNLVDDLLRGLTTYLRDGFALGGQMALVEMGLPGLFNLTNEAILARLDTYAGEMVAISGDRSLTRTTANELVGAIVRNRTNLDSGRTRSTPETIEELLAYLEGYGEARSVVRSSLIAENESVATTRSAMAITFFRSGVSRIIYRLNRMETNPGCGCDNYNGRMYEPNAIPSDAQVPRHIGCACYYEPVIVSLTELFAWIGD